VPIGFELLGPAWSDHRLLAMALAYEQAVRPRRMPPTTPRLVGGKAPGPVAFVAGEAAPAGRSTRARFTYEPVTGRLSYELPPGAAAASIHRGTPGRDGPVLHRLIDPAGASAAGAVVLPPYQRSWLIEGTLSVVLLMPDGRVTLPLKVPAR